MTRFQGNHYGRDMEGNQDGTWRCCGEVKSEGNDTIISQILK